MKSLGFKDGVEWLELEVEAQDIEGASIPSAEAVRGYARGQGIEARRWDEHPLLVGWLYIQGPRIGVKGPEVPTC